MKETNITDEKIITCLRNELNKPDYKGHLREAEEEDLQIILTRLVNKSMHDDGSNANTLISADDPEVANTYGTVIAEALEAVFSFEMCTPVTIEQLYQWNAEHRKDNPDTKVLLVKSFETSNPEALFNTITEFQKQKFNPAVILCTSNDTVEELRKYSAQGSVLYNYLCGLRKIIIPGIVQGDIADIICDRLEGEGNEVKDSFREKLAVHVEAIYPEAVLSKEAFLEDLIIRIRSVHSGKSVDLWRVYDEEDVPYSVKAEALWEKIHKNSTDNPKGTEKEGATESNENNIEESGEDYTVTPDKLLNDKCDDICKEGEPISVNDYFINRMISYVNDEKGFNFCETNNTIMNNDEAQCKKDGKKKHQILLLAMSTFPFDNKLEKNEFYTPEDGIIDDCRGQLEPISKMMLNEIDVFSTVDFVIVSTTATTKRGYYIEHGEDEDRPIKVDTNGDEEIVSNSPIVYIDDSTGKRIIFHIVKVAEVAPLEGLEQTVDTIREIYSEENKEDISLWLDIHGGYRDVNVMMAALLSLLKNEGINHDKIYSARFSDKNVIFEAKEMFDMFDFVTGMNDFFNFGSASVLKTIRDYETQDSKKLRNILELISHGTQFSAPYLYIDGIKALIGYMKDNRLNNNRVREKEHKLDIFEQNIFNDFGEDFKKFMEMDPESEDFENELIVAIIERCVDKKLYQQALTFIETLMPKFFNKKKYFYYDEKENGEIEKRKDPFMHKDNENFIFDLNLPQFYFKELNDIKDKEEKKTRRSEDASVKEVIECIVRKTKSDNIVLQNYRIGDRYLSAAIFKNAQINKKNKYVYVYDKSDDDLGNIMINVYSGISDQEKKQKLGSLFLLHKAIKECRNMFNHGSSNKSERPAIDDIEKAMKIYLKTVRYFGE